MEKLRSFKVRYIPDVSAMRLEYLDFSCEAKDEDDAQEQCEKAHPGCFVIYVASFNSHR